MSKACDGCALRGRREFLADAAAALAALVFAGARASQAQALPVRYGKGQALGTEKDEHA